MADPILSDGIKIEVAGGTYTVRPLSLSSLFRLADILNNVISSVPSEVVANLRSDTAGIILLAKGIPAAEEDVYKILAQVLGFEKTENGRTELEISKAMAVRASHVPKILEAVLEQEDLDDLFFEAKGLVKTVTDKVSTEEEAPSP